MPGVEGFTTKATESGPVDNAFAKLLSLKSDLGTAENTDITKLIDGQKQQDVIGDLDTLLARQGDVNKAQNFEYSENVDTEQVQPKISLKENSSNEFIKTFGENSETQKTLNNQESEVLKVLKNENGQAASLKTIKTESSLENILGIEAKPMPKDQKSVADQLVKINTKVSEGKPLTPKETLTLQLAAQNNIGVTKQVKKSNKSPKFNLDIASLNSARLNSTRKTFAKKGAHKTYAKGESLQSNSLIKGPVSRELIENKKMIDQDGISNMHKSADQNVSFEVLSQSSSDLSQADLKSTTKPTIDLSHINVTSKEQLINEVSNYIQRSYVAGHDQLDVVVKHDDLGDFMISAKKMDKGGEVALEIQTKLENGHDFFTQNESDLVKTLQNNGIKLSSLKIAQKSEISLTMESGKSFMGEQANDQGSSHRNSGSFSEGRQQSSQGSSSRDGQERRRELWQEANQYRQQLAS